MPLKTYSVDEAPGINLTPLIDVMFNLILFFMVATRFSEMEREIDVQVPQVAEAKPMTSPPQEIVVNIQDDGSVMLHGDPVSLVQLSTTLREARERYEDQSVLIRGDGRAVYQYVADVMSACTEAGIRHLNLGVRQKPTTLR